MKELVFKVALVLGGLILLTVCAVYAIYHTFGLGGSVLTVSGLILVGMSVWRKIDVSVSAKGFEAKLEQVEAKAIEAHAQATKSIMKAEQTSKEVGKLKHSLQVQNVQLALASKGYKVFADGYLGPQTKQAIREFQSKNGLTASGEIDSTTIRALQIPSLE
jgi:hypothetical protein